MSKSNNRPMPGVILQPDSGDAERAEDILQEIHAVLRKHGCVFAHQPNGMILGKVPPGLGTEVKVIAVVRMITPDLIEWAKIDWENGSIKPGPWKVQ